MPAPVIIFERDKAPPSLPVRFSGLPDNLNLREKGFRRAFFDLARTDLIDRKIYNSVYSGVFTGCGVKAFGFASRRSSSLQYAA